MRKPGIEPGPHAWEAWILTTELLTLGCFKLNYTLKVNLYVGFMYTNFYIINQTFSRAKLK